MSGFEQDHLQPRRHGAGNVWGLAAFSAAVFFCSVLGAKFLAGFVENERRVLSGQVPVAAFVKSGQPARLSATRAGVDYVATGTLPARQPAQLSPCGDEKGTPAGAK